MTCSSMRRLSRGEDSVFDRPGWNFHVCLPTSCAYITGLTRIALRILSLNALTPLLIIGGKVRTAIVLMLLDDQGLSRPTDTR
jgi:hypothetical protein